MSLCRLSDTGHHHPAFKYFCWVYLESISWKSFRVFETIPKILSSGLSTGVSPWDDIQASHSTRCPVLCGKHGAVLPEAPAPVSSQSTRSHELKSLLSLRVLAELSAPHMVASGNHTFVKKTVITFKERKEVGKHWHHRALTGKG